MKARVVLTIEEELQRELLNILHTSPKKVNTPKTSPSLEKELHKIQKIKLKGKNSMYLMGLDDFCLD